MSARERARATGRRIIAALAIGIVTAGCATAQRDDLIGTWELVSFAYTTGDSTMRGDTTQMRSLKVLTDTHFAWVTVTADGAAYLQPATPTRAFPALPLGWRRGLGRAGNILTHRLSEQAFWAAVRGPINRARRSVLGLPPLGRRAPFAAARGAGVPTLYGFSTAVVPKPEDWRKADHITGYWIPEPNADVDDARKVRVAIERLLTGGPAPVYIGLGSVGTGNAEQASRAILGALRDVGLRAVIALGWGGIVARSGTDVVVVKSIPHAWLFPRVAAVVHHGGAGTTAAGLLAGKPTLTIPQSAEQRFWGERVHALGVGPSPLPAGRLTRRRLADALASLSTDQAYVQAGRLVAEKLGRESGANAAVTLTERLLREGQIFPPARSVA